MFYSQSFHNQPNLGTKYWIFLRYLTNSVTNDAKYGFISASWRPFVFDRWDIRMDNKILFPLPAIDQADKHTGCQKCRGENKKNDLYFWFEHFENMLFGPQNAWIQMTDDLTISQVLSNLLKMWESNNNTYFK